MKLNSKIFKSSECSHSRRILLLRHRLCVHLLLLRHRLHVLLRHSGVRLVLHGLGRLCVHLLLLRHVLLRHTGVVRLSLHRLGLHHRLLCHRLLHASLRISLHHWLLDPDHTGLR